MAAHFCALMVFTLRPRSLAISVIFAPRVTLDDLELTAREPLTHEAGMPLRVGNGKRSPYGRPQPR